MNVYTTLTKSVIYLKLDKDTISVGELDNPEIYPLLEDYSEIRENPVSYNGTQFEGKYKVYNLSLVELSKKIQKLRKEVSDDNI